MEELFGGYYNLFTWALVHLLSGLPTGQPGNTDASLSKRALKRILLSFSYFLAATEWVALIEKIDHWLYLYYSLNFKPKALYGEHIVIGFWITYSLCEVLLSGMI